jgi:hypothetical protein
MTRRNILRVIAAIAVLAFCLAFAACDDGSNDSGSGGTSTLSGTYQGAHPPGNSAITGIYKFVFSGNTFITYWNSVPDYRGTYTISGSTITAKITDEYISEEWVAHSITTSGTLSGDGNSFTTSGVTYTKQP